MPSDKGMMIALPAPQSVPNNIFVNICLKCGQIHVDKGIERKQFQFLTH